MFGFDRSIGRDNNCCSYCGCIPSSLSLVEVLSGALSLFVVIEFFARRVAVVYQAAAALQVSVTNKGILVNHASSKPFPDSAASAFAQQICRIQLVAKIHILNPSQHA